MIIGKGDIASVLPDRDDLLFFASGVSNSREDRESEYEREMDLLYAQDNSQHIVYFGSLAIFYSDTRYTRHKLKMEYLIKKTFNKFTIVRLGNITWGKNPYTLINYFRYQKARGEQLLIRDEYRYVVDLDEFLHWIRMIPSWSCEMNIPGRRMLVSDIVKEYVYS